MTNDDWSHEETSDPLYADQRNFYKGADGLHIEEMLFAGNDLDR